MDDQGNVLFPVGEHSYRDANGNYAPKIPDGVYLCVRGMHRLQGMDEDFETFEITGVIDHTNLLFHPGNYPQIDSEGCILIGSEISKSATWMLLRSRVAFSNFMNLHANDKTFSLVISSN
jgi:hypothetical protein